MDTTLDTRDGQACPPGREPSCEEAREAGLRYVEDTVPGIRRVRAGDGFVYLGPDGEEVSDEEVLARVRGLVVPPAWTDVWICPDADGHIQATGRDARGRKQYRYHARWREARDETKFHRMVAFGEALPAIREGTEAALRGRLPRRERVLALVVRLLDETVIRIGNREYSRDNESYGLTTLRDEHVEVCRERVRFRFRGKSGKDRVVDLRDRRLARLVKRLRDLPGQELFQYAGEDGSLHVIGSGDVNAYLRELSGGDFTSKDFRTWAGTVTAARELSVSGPAASKAAAERDVVAAVKAAADLLGNTPAVARKGYVHPAVLALYLDGGFAGAWEKARRGSDGRHPGLGPDEAAVLELLRAIDG